MAYSKYVPTNERPVITKLISLAREQGYLLTVNDGEDNVIHKSASASAVRSELGGTGEDSIVLWTTAGELVGYFYLIYNNGSEDDPMIVIADYSDTAECNGIYNALYAQYSE